VQRVLLAALTVWVYELLISLPHEILFMCRPGIHFSPKVGVRFLYMFNRYGMFVTLLLYLCTVIFPVGEPTVTWCSASGAVVVTMHLLLSMSGDGLVVYVLCRYWNWKLPVTIMLAAGMMVAGAGISVFLGLFIRELTLKEIVVVQSFGSIKACTTTHVPMDLKMAFFLYIAMDFYSMGFFILNALSRPRNVTQKLVDMLLKDGLIFFVMTLVTKLASVVVVAKAQTAYAMSFPVFAMTLISVSTCRLFLTYCSAAQSRLGQCYQSQDDMQSEVLELERLNYFGTEF